MRSLFPSAPLYHFLILQAFPYESMQWQPVKIYIKRMQLHSKLHPKAMALFKLLRYQPKSKYQYTTVVFETAPNRGRIGGG